MLLLAHSARDAAWFSLLAALVTTLPQCDLVTAPPGDSLAPELYLPGLPADCPPARARGEDGLGCSSGMKNF